MKKKKEKEEALDKAFTEQAPETGEASPEQQMEEDIQLFRTLFPEVQGEDIPQEVWDRVEQGESLAASYALFAVKKYREEEKVSRINEENGKKAPPPLEGVGDEGDYFSPEAVKNMSRSEIRKHYNKILSSMEKWN